MSKSCLGALLMILVVATPAVAGPRQDRARVAGTEWASCVIDQAAKFAAQPEAADTLVTAAQGACLKKENEFRHLLREATREHGIPFARTASADQIDSVFVQVQQQVRSAAVSAIVQSRAR